MIFLYLIGRAIAARPSLDSESFDTVRNPKRRDYGFIPICKPSLVRSIQFAHV